jgi:hypothetical protein
MRSTLNDYWQVILSTSEALVRSNQWFTNQSFPFLFMHNKYPSDIHRSLPNDNYV